MDLPSTFRPYVNLIIGPAREEKKEAKGRDEKIGMYFDFIIHGRLGRRLIKIKWLTSEHMHARKDAAGGAVLVGVFIAARLPEDYV